MNKIKSFFVCIAVITACTLLLFYPKTCSHGAYNGIVLCLKTLIPSLFPFMVLSIFITDSGLYKKIFKYPSMLLAKLFRVDFEIISLFIIGMIGGYPAASKIISIQLNKGKITRHTAEIMICFCTNAGPAFLISAVGSSMFLSGRIGAILYISSVISSISLMTFYLPQIETKIENITTESSTSILKSFVKAVKDATVTLLNMSAFVVLFSVFIEVIPAFNVNLKFAGKLLYGIIEVTSGCKIISTETSLISILSASLVCGFGGLCVIAQIASICSSSKIRIKKFLLSRISHAVLSAFYTYLLLHIVPIETSQTFLSNSSEAILSHLASPISALALMICCFSFPFFLTKQKN